MRRRLCYMLGYGLLSQIWLNILYCYYDMKGSPSSFYVLEIDWMKLRLRVDCRMITLSVGPRSWDGLKKGSRAMIVGWP